MHNLRAHLSEAIDEGNHGVVGEKTKHPDRVLSDGRGGKAGSEGCGMHARVEAVLGLRWGLGERARHLHA